MKKINVALVGLGFGGSFAEIYKAHPYVNSVGLFDANPEVLANVAEHCGISKVYGSFEEILGDGDVDAVHLVTPIPLHEEQTVSALEAGKHCACTVPMAASLDGVRRIIGAARRSGRNYMMMETTLYTYQFFYVKEMIEKGELGRIQFLRGSHYQDMASWPDYWMGLPPMHYGTHAVAPMMALAGARAKKVMCLGSGSMDEALAARYGNPYPVESALLSFENGLAGEVTRSLFETSRAYQEGMFVYGSEKSFEWGFADGDDPYVTSISPAAKGGRGRETKAEVIAMPNHYARLPKEIQRFTAGEGFDPLNPQESLKKGAGAGHHGSHPHLVHEFVSSVAEGRKAWIDEDFAGHITAVCVCAHESAMRGGEPVEIPVF